MVRTLNRFTEAQDVKSEAEPPDSRTRALEVQASMDRLTGLFNRASLEDRLKDEIAYATEHGTPLSVAFIDLDRFKQINDTHGHLVGDEVLQSAARVLAAHLRQTDFIARYGGEEFLVVLPGIGADAARFVSERLLDALRRHEAMSETVKSVRVTASIGLATSFSPYEVSVTGRESGRMPNGRTPKTQGSRGAQGRAEGCGPYPAPISARTKRPRPRGGTVP